MNLYFKSIFILLLFSTLLVQANEVFVHKAIEQNLHNTPYWLKLLHYEKNESIINNQKFFLSKNGKTNSKEELKKTIKSFMNKPNTICNYPARYKWLNSKLALNIKEPQCKELKKFISLGFNKISIIFTSERYNSPASVFGHTFLKLQTDTIPYAINYSAKVPDNENQFLYAYRGITGKYPSKYSLIPYSRKDYEYRSQEFRDLLEFDINYNKEEISNILLHLFEIRNTNQNYYFIGRNCSSELIKLLDMANYDSHLSEELSSTTIPINIVYILQEKKLINNINVRLSKLKLFYQSIEELEKEEKDILFDIINYNIGIHQFDKDIKISLDSKKKIIKTAILYIEINSTQKDFKTKYIYPLIKLINLRNKYKINRKFNNKKKLKKNPISNKFHKFTIGSKINNANEKQNSFAYRYLYRNRFDLVDDLRKNGSVEFFEFRIRQIKNNSSLESLTLINLEAMPITNDFFRETTNKIKIGAKRLYYEEELFTFIDYGLGYKYKINKSLDYNIYSKTSVYYNNDEKDMYSLSLESSLEYYYKNTYISELKYEFNTYTNGIQSYNLYSNNYFKILDDTSINLSFSHKKDTKEHNSIQLNYNFIF